MKRIFLVTIIALVTLAPQPSRAQSYELQQLILDIQKLDALKGILNDMYKGYEILSTGYNTIRDLSQGNFNIHKIFLDALLAVSPTVQKYKRIADIISMQQTLLSEYKSAYSKIISVQVFDQGDISYIKTVYDNLTSRALDNLDELLMVITDNTLRMDDAERLKAIDRIYQDMADKLEFLRQFNAKAALLTQQKQQDLKETDLLKKIFGISK